MEQSAAVSISALVGVVVSVLAVGLSVAFSYAARDGRWPFRLASASLAGPAAAIVLSVRAISSTVQGSAESGSGGLGFIAGGMSEAYGLLLYAAAVSLLLLVAVGLAGVIRWDESPPGTSVRRPLVILLGGIAFVSLPMVCLRELMGLIMAVATPANSVAAAPPYFGVPATLGQGSPRVVSLVVLARGKGLASPRGLFSLSL